MNDSERRPERQDGQERNERLIGDSPAVGCLSFTVTALSYLFPLPSFCPFICSGRDRS